MPAQRLLEPEQPVRVRVRFQVGYNADIEATRRVALEAIYKLAQKE